MPAPGTERRGDVALLTGWRSKLHIIIYESDTPAGKAFDVLLLLAIALSVLAVMLESMRPWALHYGHVLRIAEWVFTILFTIEYVLRLVCVSRSLSYATSFYGVIDLLAIVPTYVSVVFPGAQFLVVIRLVRVLRVFRVLKLVRYLREAEELVRALRASRHRIFVFVMMVTTLVVMLGSMMYLIEGEENGFTSIPRSIYWAVVTLTTVGYGDLSPQTGLGQGLSAFIMLLGYGIIAVPTGMVTVELVKGGVVSGQACPRCSAEGHHVDAVYCRACGAKL